jgi:hypothetical protein
MQPVSSQRIGKHDPVATNTDTTMELLLEIVFPTLSVQNGYKEDNLGRHSWLSVESQPVKRRLGGWCDITASLGVSQ